MRFSRRHFIKLGGATAIGILGSGNFAFGQNEASFYNRLPAEALADPLFGYTADSFRRHLGTSFYMTGESEAVNAMLTAVTSSAFKNRAVRNRKAECFTLSFVLPSDAPQTTYKVFHSQLGTFDLFLVPGKNDKDESLLHAVINRI